MKESEGEFGSCWFGNPAMFWPAKKGGFHSHILMLPGSYARDGLEAIDEGKQYAKENKIECFVLCAAGAAIIIDMRDEL